MVFKRNFKEMHSIFIKWLNIIFIQGELCYASYILKFFVHVINVLLQKLLVHNIIYHIIYKSSNRTKYMINLVSRTLKS